MEIKAEVKSIEKLSDYFFVVPDYQREYVWQADDQVEQFILDIENEYDPTPNNQRSYFIGSIILVENKKGKFDVIDGQQRLTTIILALCAFRDIMKTYGQTQPLSEKAEKYFKTVQELLYKFDMETDSMQPRLELQYEDSKDYLTKKINRENYEDEQTTSINRMQAAYLALTDHYEKYLKEGLEALTSYLRYFLLKIELVIIESKELSSALKIFETINQRGVGLNAMDLVKNLIFSESIESDFNTIKDHWKEIVQNLQACNEDQSPLRFLRYFLIARYHDGILREDDIYKWIISAEGKSKIGYETNALGFSKELKKASKRYSLLVNATEKLRDGGEFRSVTNIGFINKYKSRQHLILLLALKDSIPNEDIDFLASQIESFFFYSNVMKIQAKNNEGLFAGWAKELRKLSNREEIRNFVDHFIYPYLSKLFSRFKSSFLNINEYDFNPLYRKRFVLSRLENHIRSKTHMPEKGHEFYEKLQVEHILPQTPKDNIIPDEFTDIDEYKAYVYSFGNVTLLESGINQAVNNFNDLKSDWFEKKLVEYRKSDIISTNLLDHTYSIGIDTAVNRYRDDHDYIFNKWDKASIYKRQKVLLSIALDCWRINNKSLQNDESGDNPENLL